MNVGWEVHEEMAWSKHSFQVNELHLFSVITIEFKAGRFFELIIGNVVHVWRSKMQLWNLIQSCNLILNCIQKSFEKVECRKCSRIILFILHQVSPGKASCVFKAKGSLLLRGSRTGDLLPQRSETDQCLPKLQPCLTLACASPQTWCKLTYMGVCMWILSV